MTLRQGFRRASLFCIGTALAFGLLLATASSSHSLDSALFDCGRHFSAIGAAGPLSASVRLQALRKIFAIRGKRISPEQFTLDGHTYRVDRLFQGGSHQVMEGVDEVGRGVVVKELPGMSLSVSGWLQDYEELVTRYYRAKGVDVPRILARDKHRGILVKDYFAGVTLKELRENFRELLGSESALATVELELKREQERLGEIHRGFGAWVRTQREFPLPFGFYSKAEHLIDDGDLKDSNFIYDPLSGKWRLFDP